MEDIGSEKSENKSNKYEGGGIKVVDSSNEGVSDKGSKEPQDIGCKKVFR